MDLKKALVVGAGGMIGKALCKALERAGYEVRGTTRAELNLMALPDDISRSLGFSPDVVYLCAAMTRFIDCEQDRHAYEVNVDAPLEIARQLGYARIVYLSSEAVERALHTNYGMHKALCEIGLRAIGSPVIARLAKVDPWSLEQCCEWLVWLAEPAVRRGVYRWHSWDEPMQTMKFRPVRGGLLTEALVRDGIIELGPRKT
ncbi:sugar nucleotide-binding protein [Microbacterium sp.]|uniref:sugar nucleotide-binding protein n=1 Tax=Microbacterium sp. TaxID=51671 RepID=UPI0027357361|nr:sugar nucleotide-binding protein [Microbacterium sp.]MDP3952643.1 sugar nucleotide-binding protein [Microbacterium sp.]